MTWRTIDSAPKDTRNVIKGGWVFVYRPNVSDPKRRYDLDYRIPELYNGNWAMSCPSEPPTHWMLPEPPEGE